jgi:hypothetical protein
VAAEQQHARPHYVDRPALVETFADSIHTMLWDGNTLRIEFCVTRFPTPGSSTEAQPQQHPACRLILTAPAAADLFNRLQQTMNALTKAGLLAPRKTEPSGPAQG